jgi:hypothetical protein
MTEKYQVSKNWNGRWIVHDGIEPIQTWDEEMDAIEHAEQLNDSVEFSIEEELVNKLQARSERLNEHQKSSTISSLIEHKMEYQKVMKKIVDRFSVRIKNDVYLQSIEAMREDLWYSQIEIQEILKQ